MKSGGLQPRSRQACRASSTFRLAATVALMARDHGITLALQVLFYPSVHPSSVSESFKQFSKGVMLDAELMRWFESHARGAGFKSDWRREPFKAASHQGVAPAWIGLAAVDPLVDEGGMYAELLREAGVLVEVKTVKQAWWMGLLGLMLPILIVQDVVGVWAFRRTIDWRGIGWMLPGAGIGILLGYRFASSVQPSAVLALVGGISIAFGLWHVLPSRSLGDRNATMGSVFGDSVGRWAPIAVAVAHPRAAETGSAGRETAGSPRPRDRPPSQGRASETAQCQWRYPRAPMESGT